MTEEKAAFAKACEDFEARRAEVVAQVQQRQGMIRQVVESARVKEPESPSRWVILPTLKRCQSS